MKTFTHFRKFAAVCFIAAASVTAQAQTPIGCNGQYYISHGPISGATGATLLDKLTFSGGNMTATSFALNNGTANTYGFNAIGINPVDGYIYAVRYPANNATGRLIRIGNGAVNEVDLGAISGMVNNDIAYGGCFDSDGTFYFATQGGRFYKIVNPVTSQVATQVASSGFGSIVDMAINPADGQMYGTTTGNTNWLVKINKSTGVITNVSGVPNLGTSNFFAGLFMDESGNLYGYRSDGPFYLINKTTGALTAAGSAAAYSGADGCGCSFGRVFHELDAQNAICPNIVTPNPTFPITITLTNQTSTAKTGLSYTLDMPGNRFSFNETAATIAANLFAAGVLPSNNPSQVTISSTTGTNNKIVISSIKTGDVNTTLTFTLQLKLTTLGGTYAPVALQSEIAGLPAAIGGTDLSNDPGTAAPDDATVIGFCPNITLPVQLLSFSASYNNNTTLLNWDADNETNFAFYEVERSSNGTDYSSLAVKHALANMTGMQQHYQYSDDLFSTSGNTFFYRLKMTDIDGKFSYSKVVMVRRDMKLSDDISIAPNPAVRTGTANIRISTTVSGNVEIQIVDMSGVVVLKQHSQVAQGNNSIAISNLNKLTPGIYIAQVNDGEKIQTTKFSVTR